MWGRKITYVISIDANQDRLDADRLADTARLVVAKLAAWGEAALFVMEASGGGAGRLAGPDRTGPKEHIA